MSMAESGEMGEASGEHSCVVKATCEGRRVTYTGVAPSGEIRDCARCMGDVRIEPGEGEVVHVE
jgi:hypothetical protein